MPRPRVVHWPVSKYQCTCGYQIGFQVHEDTYDNQGGIFDMREHTRLWCRGTTRIEFKRKDSDRWQWVSTTRVPGHMFTWQPDALDPSQWRLKCTCGWRQWLDDGILPGRAALGHVREVVEAIFK